MPSIRIVISRPARRSRIGTDRIWVSSSLPLGNGSTTSTSAPSDVDAFDQRGEDGTPACSGQLEPTHRVAIANSRLVALDERGVTSATRTTAATGRRGTAQ
jgi:hypothetical protein